MSQSLIASNSSRLDHVQLEREAHQRLVAIGADRSAPVAQTFTLAAQAGLLAGPFLSMVDSNIVDVGAVLQRSGLPALSPVGVSADNLVALPVSMQHALAQVATAGFRPLPRTRG